jgi:hypothetical protein
MRQTQSQLATPQQCMFGSEPADRLMKSMCGLFSGVSVFVLLRLLVRLHSHEEESSAQTIHLGSIGEISVTDTIEQVSLRTGYLGRRHTWAQRLTSHHTNRFAVGPVEERRLKRAEYENQLPVSVTQNFKSGSSFCERRRPPRSFLPSRASVDSDGDYHTSSVASPLQQ